MDFFYLLVHNYSCLPESLSAQSWREKRKRGKKDVLRDEFCYREMRRISAAFVCMSLFFLFG
jgi:hypothetical protein